MQGIRLRGWAIVIGISVGYILVVFGWTCSIDKSCVATSRLVLRVAGMVGRRKHREISLVVFFYGCLVGVALLLAVVVGGGYIAFSVACRTRAIAIALVRLCLRMGR